MKSHNHQTDAKVAKILETLRQEYLPTHPSAKVDAYRYNSACIRIRIVDPGFAGTHITERDDLIWKTLRTHLPADVFQNISLLLLLTPKETRTSATNQEFEDPWPATVSR